MNDPVKDFIVSHQTCACPKGGNNLEPSDLMAHQHHATCPLHAPLRTPAPRLDPVIEAVRADLHRRSQLGIAKYGTTLADNRDTHRAKLQHAYEEALDLANYLKWAILELDAEMVGADAGQAPAP